jgi:hypothetical protein
MRYEIIIKQKTRLELTEALDTTIDTRTPHRIQPLHTCMHVLPQIVRHIPPK